MQNSNRVAVAPNASEFAVATPTGCVLCGNISIDKVMLESFNEIICTPCKFMHEEYKTISKKDAMERFLVPDGRFAKLNFLTKPNPQNANWTPMRLFLLKHVRAASLERFGSDAAMQQERLERHKRKFEKEESIVVETFALRTLHSDDDAACNGSITGATCETGGVRNIPKSLESSASTTETDVLLKSCAGATIDRLTTSSHLHERITSVSTKQKTVTATVLASAPAALSKSNSKASQHAQRKKALMGMIRCVRDSHNK